MTARPESVCDVLLVDDSPVVRQMVIFALVSDAYTVCDADGATEALRQLGERTFDVIITDFEMPGLNGIELVREIRKDPRHEETQFVMMAGGLGKTLEAEALAAGVAVIVPKPFMPAELKSALESVFGPQEAVTAGSRVVNASVGELASQADAGKQHWLTAATILEALPYMAMILDEHHNVFMANDAYYEVTGAYIDDGCPICAIAVHGVDGGVPDACPLVVSRRTARPCTNHVDDPVHGRLRVSVYPLKARSPVGTRLYLHLAEPVDG